MNSEDYFHLYIGCNTTFGKLVGVNSNSCFTETTSGQIVETSFREKPFPVKLISRRLRELSDEESKILIAKGISIGRPKGYSFSPEAFLFLLSCSVDLFGLLDKGLAVSPNSIND
ncbi:MAG TPA: hypothetical protein VM012_02250 [Flavitalea sp.]|nr:hypothetical protein [Flavitalea sp.]